MDRTSAPDAAPDAGAAAGATAGEVAGEAAGARPSPACAGCGAARPPAARYCPMCGVPLDRSPGTTRKHVAVLFCDLVGSTGLAERLDPELWRDLIEDYFATAAQAIARHGGRVEKFIGDAVVAVFGLPRRREDDALRAVAAGLDIVRRMNRRRLEVSSAIGTGLEVRIGISSGEVVVGSGRAQDTFVTGDAVNVAARLQQAAGRGEVLISAPVLTLVEGRVTVGAAGTVVAKGKTAPVGVWRVIGLEPPPPTTRPHAVPFVGRERELAELDEAVRGIRASGTAGVISVCGPAGIGKSRLVSEFVGAADQPWAVGHCQSFGDGIALRPVIQLAQQLVSGVGRQPSPAPDFGERERAAFDRALETVTGYAAEQIEEASKEEIVWTLSTLLRGCENREQTILVLEDFQWAPRIMVEVVEGLLQEREVKAAIVLVERGGPAPQAAPPARGVPVLRVVEVPPLRPEESAGLLGTLLRSDPDAQLPGTAIVEMADGNPLYLKELASSLAETGRLDLLARSASPSLQAVLEARLDALGYEEQDVLHRAAVVGRTFSYEALEACGAARDARTVLAGLVGKGVIEHSATAHGATEPGAAEPGLSEPGLGEAESVDHGLADHSVLGHAVVTGDAAEESATEDGSPENGSPEDRLLDRRHPRGAAAPERAGDRPKPATGYRFATSLMRETAYRAAPKRNRADWHWLLAAWMDTGVSIMPHGDVVAAKAHHLASAWELLSEVTTGGPRVPHLRGLAGEALYEAGVSALERGDLTSAAECFDRALELVDPYAPRSVEIGVLAGECRLHLNGPAAAQRSLENCGRRLEANPLWTATAAVESAALNARVTGSAPSPAELDRLRIRLEAAGPGPYERRRLLLLRTQAAAAVSRIGAAEALLEEALALPRELESRWDHRQLLTGLCELSLWGPSPTAVGRERCESLLKRFGSDRRLAAPTLGILASLAALQGESGRALRYITTAKQDAAELGLRLLAAVLHSHAANVALYAGDLPGAERELREGRRMFTELGIPEHTVAVDIALAGVLADQRRWADARAVLSPLRTRPGHGDPAGAGLCAAVEGQLRAAAGEDPGDCLAEAGRAAVAAADNLLSVGEIHFRRAQSLRAYGRPAEAAAAGRAALLAYRRKGATSRCGTIADWLADASG
ncbi:hypothetical protein GCM10009760_14960 [Kitasatospora kazusensis]|uniref:Guanylate cyclase domain-containing protein n=1 Tax=Kitasatospora kazusensis TaxID=407974 RepID=A0ABP5KQB9_9ACTN